MLNTLINIAEKEMTTYGLDIVKETAFVEKVTVNDNVSDEFMIDPNVAFTATVYNSEKYGDETELGQKSSECIIDWQTGAVERKTFTAGTVNQTDNITGELNVTVDPSSNVKTTTVTFADADGNHTLTVVENPPELGGNSTVKYDFDRVYNTKKCNLNFGIVAREDYIGSNNVFSNIGTPDLSYRHYKLDGDGNYIINPQTGEREFTQRPLQCQDTPEVNVPIRFDTTDGGKKVTLLDATVNLGTDAELDSHVITQAVEDLVDNYDQINGTLQYTWVLPDGTRAPVGEVSISRGAVQGSFPALDYDYIAHTAGEVKCRLEVTFTPDAFENNKNFKSDGVTNVQVNDVMHDGSVWIDAISADSTMGYYIRKEWRPEAPDNITSIDYRLSDGSGGFVKQTLSEYEITSNADDATVFHLNAADGWETRITGLPPMKTVNGQNVRLIYKPEEINIPEGYGASYSTSTKIDDVWSGYLSLTLRPSAKIVKNDSHFLHINFSYGGETYDYDLPLALTSDLAANGTLTLDFRSVELPLNDSHQPLGSISVNSLFTYKDKTNAGEYNKQNNSLLPGSSAASVPEKTGTVLVPVLIICNGENTMPVELIKVNQADQPLSGAEFALYASDADGNICTSPMTGYENLVSDNNGVFTPADDFCLVFGTYYLVETKAPAGCLSMETPVRFSVDDTGIHIEDGDAETETQDEAVVIKVHNTSVYKLPEAGGRGAGAFSLGGVLIIALSLMSGFTSWRRRKRGNAG